MTKALLNSVDQDDYLATLHLLKGKIKQAQLKAALSVNAEMIQLYWELGEIIAEKQKSEGWGSKVIEKVSRDLKKALPESKGFSVSNLFRMSNFYRSYQTLAQAVREFKTLPIFHIPWGHNVLLVEILKNTEKRLWYAQETIKNGWSRNRLRISMGSNLYERQGKSIENFHHTLPSAQSDLVKQTLKDPYCLDFLSLTDDCQEREIEKAIINHIQKFLIELGQGFAFLGSQFRLQCKGREYFLDLVFYHTKLYRYFIIELKNNPFKAEYAGKMNLYLSLVDDFLKSPKDESTIGLILCRGKNSFEAEYALRGINRPIGVSHFETELVKSLPKNLSSSLPSIDEIETELNMVTAEGKAKKSGEEK